MGERRETDNRGKLDNRGKGDRGGNEDKQDKREKQEKGDKRDQQTRPVHPSRSTRPPARLGFKLGFLGLGLLLAFVPAALVAVARATISGKNLR